MFRKYLYAFLCLNGIALACPQTSFAIDWYWIDSLSGPKFSGPVAEWRIVCFKHPEDKSKLPVDGKVRTAGILGGVSGSIGPSCEYKPGQRRQGSIQVAYGFLSSEPTPRFAGGESVKLTTLEPSFTWQLKEDIPLEVGLGVGLHWFSSRGLDAFHRATLHPLRIDFRPFDWAESTNTRGSWWAAAFVVRLGVVVFPQGFGEADFRDTNGGIEPREIKKYMAVSIDTEPIVRRFITNTWLWRR